MKANHTSSKAVHANSNTPGQLLEAKRMQTGVLGKQHSQDTDVWKRKLRSLHHIQPSFPRCEATEVYLPGFCRVRQEVRIWSPIAMNSNTHKIVYIYIKHTTNFKNHTHTKKKTNTRRAQNSPWNTSTFMCRTSKLGAPFKYLASCVMTFLLNFVHLGKHTATPHHFTSKKKK